MKPVKVVVASMFTSPKGYILNSINSLFAVNQIESESNTYYYSSRIYKMERAQFNPNFKGYKRYNNNGIKVDDNNSRTREGFLKSLFEQFIIDDNTVVLALIDGYIEGYDYGGCLNEKEFIAYKIVNNANEYVYGDELRHDNSIKYFSKKHSIYFLSIDAWQRISGKPNFNFTNYIIDAIYRDVFRFICQNRIANDSGDKRCIFTTNTFDRIEDCIYAIQYPIISRKAQKQLKNSLLCCMDKRGAKGLVRQGRIELKKYRPNLWKDRFLIRLKSEPIKTIVIPFSIAVVSSLIGTIVGGIIVEAISNLIWRCC